MTTAEWPAIRVVMRNGGWYDAVGVDVCLAPNAALYVDVEGRGPQYLPADAIDHIAYYPSQEAALAHNDAMARDAVHAGAH